MRAHGSNSRIQPFVSKGKTVYLFLIYIFIHLLLRHRVLAELELSIDQYDLVRIKILLPLPPEYGMKVISRCEPPWVFVSNT